MGEFGASSTPAGLNVLADICQEMSANPDVWLGWTAWAAGPFWPADYMFNLSPAPDRAMRPQTRILAAHAKPDADTYWVKPAAAIDVDITRERWHGCPSPDAVLQLTSPRIPRAGQSGLMHVRGPLLALMQSPAFTLLVETENLASPAESCDLVSSTSGAMLRRTGDGALGTSWGGVWRTRARSLADWRGRQRCAFSLSRTEARIAIAATGCGSVSRHARIAEIDNAIISAGPAGGRVVRVTAFPHFLDTPALEAIVA